MLQRRYPMSSVRYLAGLYAGKAANTGLKLLKRKGTYFPGVVSLKLDPKFISHIPKPKKIIAVTGTNGKTTTTNLILEILRKKGESPVNNSLGSNTIHGILTAFSGNIDLLGKKKEDLAVLEVDERFTPIIFKDAPPDILAITNIYQDSYKRNAHTDFIKSVINRGIPKTTKIVVNGDDLIASTIGLNENKVYYGIDRLPNETEQRDSRLKDLRNCPVCGESLTWDFVRYHHIGRAHCESCGFKNGELKYKVVEADFDAMNFKVVDDGKEYIIPLTVSSLEGIYNQLAAYSVLREYGLDAEEIIKLMGGLKVIESRFSTAEKNGKKIIMISAKGINPIANSRVFDSVKNYKGKKSVIVMNDNSVSGIYTEMISWIYDADFEYLNNEDLNRIIFTSWKCMDFKVRCLMGGFPEDKIFTDFDYKNSAKYIDPNADETIFILHDIEDESVDRANYIKDEIFAKMEESK